MRTRMCWGCIFVFIFTFIASPAPTRSFYTSALTNNSLYACPGLNCLANGLYYYQMIGFMTTTSGDYDFQSNCTFNIFGIIVDRIVHQATDPNVVLMSDDDVRGDTRFLMTISLQAMYNYTLMVTTYYSSTTGSFSVSAAGDPPLTFFAVWVWLWKNKIKESFFICSPTHWLTT